MENRLDYLPDLWKMGIAANESYPADFVLQNLAIQTNVLQEAWKAGVRELLFLGTACIYPRDCPQPKPPYWK